MNPTSFITSPAFVRLVLVLTMLGTLEHATVVYHGISANPFSLAWLNWAYAALVVIFIDLATLAFVVNGQHRAALLFALGQLVVNIIYYGGVNLWAEVPAGPGINKAMAAVTFSLMLCSSLYLFSKLLLQLREVSPIDTGELNQLRHELALKAEQLASVTSQLAAAQALLTCTDCGAVFSTSQALAGHKGKCKARPDLVSA
jgi:hypothetical protein